jgi:Xaa-Pro aminopeptidase
MQRCMALSHAGVHEQLLATEFEYGVKLAGASRLAYPVVAGGGADSCTIHYSRNDKQVRCTHTGCVMLLSDAGEVCLLARSDVEPLLIWGMCWCRRTHAPWLHLME